jgi:uncharacterized protein
MILLLNTTKTLDTSLEAPAKLELSQPAFMKQARRLMKVLGPLDREDLSSLMGLSEKLASETRADIALWGKSGRQAGPAFFAFTGLVYKSIDVPTLSVPELRRAQKQVRILSGLYGVLRPLDLVESYRLEMGLKLPVDGARNMVGYWKETLTDAINDNLKNGEPIINLAAQEYLKALDVKKLVGPVISPVFKEVHHDGTMKTVTVHAKKARGAMIRFTLQNKVAKPADLLGFGDLGWEASSEPPESGNWLFTRSAEPKG